MFIMTAYIIINTNRGCLHTIKRKTKRSEQIRQGLERAASNDCPFEIIFKKVVLNIFEKIVDISASMAYNKICSKEHVRLAQLDRAFGYGPKGREFESSNARI